MKTALDAAHLSPYATDSKNRANPANGVCLCAYCHRALDRRLIAIQASGDLLVCPSIDDAIAKEHFTRVTPDLRRLWLSGVNPEFLELGVEWFKENLTNSGLHRAWKKRTTRP
jgi:predicted restriction endonuclease